jgi:hypothetical protein
LPAALLHTGEHELPVAWLLLALLVTACADEQPPALRAEGRVVIRVRPAAPEAEPGSTSLEAPRMRVTRPGDPPSRARRAPLASADPGERERAVLEFEGDLAALAPLASDDASADVRRAAVQRLADGERPIERAALRRALGDTDPDVVVEAILALSALDEKSAIPTLERLRAHPDSEVRALAAEALDSLRP